MHPSFFHYQLKCIELHYPCYCILLHFFYSIANISFCHMISFGKWMDMFFEMEIGKYGTSHLQKANLSLSSMHLPNSLPIVFKCQCNLISNDYSNQKVLIQTYSVLWWGSLASLSYKRLCCSPVEYFLEHLLLSPIIQMSCFASSTAAPLSSHSIPYYTFYICILNNMFQNKYLF